MSFCVDNFIPTPFFLVDCTFSPALISLVVQLGHLLAALLANVDVLGDVTHLVFVLVVLRPYLFCKFAFLALVLDRSLRSVKNATESLCIRLVCSADLNDDPRIKHVDRPHTCIHPPKLHFIVSIIHCSDSQGDSDRASDPGHCLSSRFIR